MLNEILQLITYFFYYIIQYFLVTFFFSRLKDGREIELIARIRVQTRTIEGQVTSQLIIDDVVPEDAGKYTVVVENIAGKDSCEATLNVTGKRILLYLKQFMYSILLLIAYNFRFIESEKEEFYQKFHANSEKCFQKYL